MGKKGKGKKGSGDNKEEETTQKPPQQPSEQAGASQPATTSTSQQSIGKGRGKASGQQPVVVGEQQSQGSGGGQQQPARGRGKQQQQQQPLPSQQQQQAPPQQQPQGGRGPQPQQQARGPPQQQPARGPPQQQLPPGGWAPPQQHQQPPPGWGPPQHQVAGGPPQQQQQQARGPPQQQQARGPPQQQQPPGGWAPPQQHQQPPPGWGPPQQQARGPPQQQQPPGGWAPPQQQTQPPPGWGPPQHQVAGGPPQQQQQQARGPPQQQQPPPGLGRGQQTGDGGQKRGKGRGRQASGGDQQQQRPGAPEQQHVEQGRGSQPPSRPDSQQSSRQPSLTPSESSVKSDTRQRPGSGPAPSSRGSTPVSSTSMEQISSGLQQASVKGSPAPSTSTSRTKMDPKDMQLEIPQRKDLRQGGKMGMKIMVETNHVALNFKFAKNETAIHYDVAITPDNPKRLMRRVWNAFKARYLPEHPLAFDDFRNAYSPRELPFNNDIGGEVEVAEDQNGRPRAYRVVMKYAATVNLHELMNYMATGGRVAVPQEALQCIDIVLRNCSAMRFTKVGRSFFSPPHGRIVELGDGLELWHGFFQSAVIGWKPFLNVDVAHKGFPTPQSVLKLIAEMSSDRNRQCREGELDDYKLPQIQSFLKGLKIQYEIPNQPASRRSYRINGFKGRPAETTFEVDGNKMTITQYFQNSKNYRIQFPNIPVLWVGPRDRNIYLPSELCTIMPGQVVNRKLNEIQTAQMVRSAATSTDVRKQKIMDSLKLANFNNDPVVQAFGMNVGNQFERVNARWLQPPQLQYKNNIAKPSRGQWRAFEFLDPSKVSKWTIINLDRRTRDDNIADFARSIKTEANKLGVEIGEAVRPFLRMDRFNRNEFQSSLDKYKRDGIKITFVVLPDSPTNVYSQVKQTSELNVGLVTQCIKSKTMYRMSPATVGNILLKVNAKMNGLNHTIADVSRPPCLRQPCMIMGADVTHPSPDQNDIPSVAAVTASCDPKAFKYNFCWRLQPARQEIIQDLEQIVREQLIFFFKQSGQKPMRIIFFRDGVSEGQFREVMNTEVQAIRRACKSVPGDYRPPITFLVVQKRHHTRFFPRQGETEDKNNNVRAGTVVDTEITHPSDLEYYLVSHASIQGVARPTKYRVLWDDSNMGEDELEHLTYYLCHLFSRCTRSVSYPAPTYYAHLAAFRARVYLEGRAINLDNLPAEQKNRTIKEEVCRGFPMFFV